MKSSSSSSYSSWQDTQGAILTSNNAIVVFSLLHRDYQLNDLPHYYLRNRTTRKTFHAWLKANRKSHIIIGAWSRPIFAGGFQESSEIDTYAFNLQSPSFFIDMRFSHPRPMIYGKQKFSDYSNEELFILSQQHCFAGYTLPDLPRKPKESLSFTRHHIIDWNYHPSFPRNRPNRWFIQYYSDPSSNQMDSFKEYSTVRDPDGVPIYYERWQRIVPTIHQQQKYLVLRKTLPCSKLLQSENRHPTEAERRDGILIVIGNHFAFVQDREYTKLSQYDSNYKDHLLRNGKGGGGAFIRYLINRSNEENSNSLILRELMEEYLDLEGNYGLLSTNGLSGLNEWNIYRSTFPWNENTQLFNESDGLLPVYEKDHFVALKWTSSSTADRLSIRSLRAQGNWEVLECSFTITEIHQLFGNYIPPRSKL